MSDDWDVIRVTLSVGMLGAGILGISAAAVMHLFVPSGHSYWFASCEQQHIT